jgi:hypothetical protein
LAAAVVAVAVQAAQLGVRVVLAEQLLLGLHF